MKAQILSPSCRPPIAPPIKGADLPHVVQAWDVLQDKVYTGKKVAIIGGGAVGVETALFLAEKGTLSGDAVKFLLVNQAETPEVLLELATRGTKEIVLIEMIKRIGKDIGLSTRWGMLQEISRINVRTSVSTKALEITEHAVLVEIDGKTEEIQADSVVMAVGSKACNPLQEMVENMGIPCQVAGDAKKIALAFDAVHGGFAAGRNV